MTALQDLQSGSPISISKLLETVTSDLGITTWRYDQEEGSPVHIGMMAQDAKELFGIGSGSRIPTVDYLGLLLCCVQELGLRDRENQQRIKDLEGRLRKLETDHG